MYYDVISHYPFISISERCVALSVLRIAPPFQFMEIRSKFSKNAGRFALRETIRAGHFAPTCINKRYTEFTKF